MLLVLAAFAHLLLRHTRFGLRLLATGGDAESARRAGVDVARVRRAAFVLSGVGAALGGLLVAGRLGTGYPNAGQGFELDAIVAAVLGGTSLAGGRGTIAGTIAAVLVLGVIANVLNLLEVSAFVQTLAKGLIVVAAILATRARSGRSPPAGNAGRHRHGGPRRADEPRRGAASSFAGEALSRWAILLVLACSTSSRSRSPTRSSSRSTSATSCARRRRSASRRSARRW